MHVPRLCEHGAVLTKRVPVRPLAPRRSMHRALLASSFILCLVPAAFDRGAWLRDYAALKQALEARYSNLAWFASPEGGVDLPALDKRTVAALRAAASDDDAREALLSFVRAFHDGH